MRLAETEFVSLNEFPTEAQSLQFYALAWFEMLRIFSVSEDAIMVVAVHSSSEK